jgi:exodeoxyribonuclease VII large subunit
MARGYSYTTLDQTIVKSVQQLALAKTIDVHLQDGMVRAEVIDIQEEHHE